jgi:hypothetical protein
MIIDIETYKIVKEVEINQIIISIVNIDFENKSAMFKVFFSNSVFDANDSNKYISIEGDEYSAWGEDDEYIINLILSKLGLNKLI